ncbi:MULTISPECIES: hypothetical protein [Streptomyces]|uniref:hypothetical protein n=1 Tax=Streptomyces TaxID=1883 RepID=UPI00136B9F06|nr:hypothetical protein [Streptomyces sp. SID5914]MZG13181.1 hypothetical protein [Streptomyces sp. SID5914]
MNAKQWNARYPVGKRVMAYPSVRPENPLAVTYQERAAAGSLPASWGSAPCRRLNTVTQSVAWTFGHGAPVVLVEGETGGIVLNLGAILTEVAMDEARG